MIKWIKLTEALPPSKGEYLTYTEGEVIQARYDSSQTGSNIWAFSVLAYHGCGCCAFDSLPDYWAELPNLPEE